MKKSVLITAILTAGALLFTSCHDDIFNTIMDEVALESNGLNGTVQSIVRYGESLYLANGKIYKKTNKPSSETGEYNCQWSSVSSPDSSEYQDADEEVQIPAQVTFLASDSNYLYALAIIYHDNSDGYNVPYNRILFCASAEPSKAEDWTQVDISSITGSSYADLAGLEEDNQAYIASIFDNQSTESTARHAYARIYSSSDSAYHVYKLNGTSAPTVVSDGTNGASASSCRAVLYNSEDYFSNCIAFAANDTYIYYAKSYVSSGSLTTGSVLFYANQWDSTNGYTLSGTETSVSLDAGSILSIAPAADKILLGTTSGLAHTAITDGVPSASSSSFNTNGDSIISSYVPMVFVLDPSKKEDLDASSNTSEAVYGTDEYACSVIYGSISSSSDTYAKTGLYAYYPGRGSWNRDGTADNTSGGN